MKTTTKIKQRKITLNSFECCVVVGVLNFLYENKLVWDMSQDSPMNWHEMSKLFVDDLKHRIEIDKEKECKLTVADALIVSDLLTEGCKSQLLKEYSQGKIIHWYNLASVVKEQIDNQIGR